MFTHTQTALPLNTPPPHLPQLVLLALPLRIPPPKPIQRFLRFSLVAANDYFPVKIVWEGREQDYEAGPFVIGARMRRGGAPA
jgi:hypothetical protein